MATTTITRKSVLTAIKDGKGYADLTDAERTVFEKMLSSVSKKSVPTVSKVHVANVNDAKKLAGMLAEGQVFNGAFIRAHLPMVQSASKSTAILRAGVGEGLFISHVLTSKVGEYGKGTRLYMLATTEHPVWGDEVEE